MRRFQGARRVGRGVGRHRRPRYSTFSKTIRVVTVFEGSLPDGRGSDVSVRLFPESWVFQTTTVPVQFSLDDADTLMIILLPSTR